MAWYCTWSIFHTHYTSSVLSRNNTHVWFNVKITIPGLLVMQQCTILGDEEYLPVWIVMVSCYYLYISLNWKTNPRTYINPAPYILYLFSVQNSEWTTPIIVLVIKIDLQIFYKYNLFSPTLVAACTFIPYITVPGLLMIKYLDLEITRHSTKAVIVTYHA